MPKHLKRTKKRRSLKSKKSPGFLSWWRKRQQRKKNKQNTEKKLKQGINKYKNYRYKSQKLNEAEKFGAKNNSSWFNSKKYGTIQPVKSYLSTKNVNKLLRNLKNKQEMNSTYTNLKNNYRKYSIAKKKSPQVRFINNLRKQKTATWENPNYNKMVKHIGQPVFPVKSLTRTVTSKRSPLSQNYTL